MKWLHEAITDDKTLRVSTARLAVLSASVTLCLSTLWLTVAATWRVELVPALTVFGGALATMAGAGYVTSKAMSGSAKND